jgi:hypothetical protein
MYDEPPAMSTYRLINIQYINIAIEPNLGVNRTGPDRMDNHTCVRLRDFTSISIYT